MPNVDRTLLEDHLYYYNSLIGMPNQRGEVISATFLPTLVVDADGTETDGRGLAAGLAYLDAHHGLRVSVWDLLKDELLRSSAASLESAVRESSLAEWGAQATTQWYRRYRAFYDPKLFRVFRPLDVVKYE
jgi:hypothetical protein